ncbi:hypothetical protein BU14_0286s0015 [Porphyra umbilicalis]|uniref:Uncharacterized protein n=1 Tax=Porphyra umbilicalis TaxID=2786 RepID=A0A1X6P0W6_PORUM|nr:hypothetical protein BU14_0286s0015 [Porphyra umbilicalis]|eukprot:OSX74502.1 hypothetical protein BU14_0286s0015 [Porphyra umbilicalis]
MEKEVCVCRVACRGSAAVLVPMAGKRLVPVPGAAAAVWPPHSPHGRRWRLPRPARLVGSAGCRQRPGGWRTLPPPPPSAPWRGATAADARAARGGEATAAGRAEGGAGGERGPPRRRGRPAVWRRRLLRRRRSTHPCACR